MPLSFDVGLSGAVRPPLSSSVAALASEPSAPSALSFCESSCSFFFVIFLEEISSTPPDLSSVLVGGFSEFSSLLSTSGSSTALSASCFDSSDSLAEVFASSFPSFSTVGSSLLPFASSSGIASFRPSSVGWVSAPFDEIHVSTTFNISKGHLFILFFF